MCVDLDLPPGRNLGSSKQSTRFHVRFLSPTVTTTRRRMGGSLAIGFHLQCRRPLTSPFHYPTLTFGPYNSVFQTLFYLPTLFFGVFLLVFLDFFKVKRRFVDCRANFYSNAVFFLWKGGRFPCKILFFWYFSDFRRLFELDLLL